MPLKISLDKIAERESKCIAQVFNRLPVAVVRGKGMYLYDTGWNRYLDLFSGIAVNNVGHCHPKVVKAVQKQAETLMHVSNWVYTLPQVELAEKLKELTGMERVFYNNDGSGAVETALKLARKVSGKKEFVSFKNSFHGRTMGALSVTWGDKYRKPFQPLVPGAKFADYNSIDSLKSQITEDTAAVIVEPVQGEAGINVPDPGFLKEVRELTEERDVLLIVDECQTGFGRTGKMFAFQHENIRPDILVLAKSLGGGFPISATLYGGFDFEKGEQGGTFNGNPLACAAAKAAVDVILKEKLAEKAGRMGASLMEKMRDAGVNPRGMGLMVGFDAPDGRETVLKLIGRKILAIPSGNAVRVLPPLIIEEKHVKLFADTLRNLR